MIQRGVVSAHIKYLKKKLVRSVFNDLRVYEFIIP